jgi:predicted nucleotidyltransferase
VNQATAESMNARTIESYVSQLVREFHPERVILFGSHARGEADADSDVDLLVVMECEGNTTEHALDIRRRIPRSFPLDLIVRTPAQFRQRVREKDGFLRSILEQGTVLYEGQRSTMAAQG